MARRRKSEDVEDSNVVEIYSNRAPVIREALSWVLTKQEEVRALNAEIAAYKAEHIRGELGWKIKTFNALLGITSLEDEQRQKELDDLREGLRAINADWAAYLAGEAGDAA